ncbi:transmembrane BAX inhibitor motif containing 1a isoform X2 [Clupea harengus]|uniref:Transmembrane BAX inhibitor motif containing 1a isoform X2 n=1 Tax=Clupea harengus TaxID=7950 RepID=A0A6P8GHU7_CLUHA|nr:transmembrane BAX inhibitor motif containing 1a isoform X2 [Clupea harengus]
MSRSDFPPGYDDSRAPLYNAQGGNYPPPPSYDFSPYGGQPQPGPYPGAPNAQPSAPYPGQPSAPYPGQPSGPYPGEPSGPYPGQPGGYSQSGPKPGLGYPPSGMPPMPIFIPPTMPSTGDVEGFTTSGDWDDISIRHKFIRKVYLILTAQLAVTVGIVAVFCFVEPVSKFVRNNPALYWASYAVYFITHIVLVCCNGPRRRYPWNLILLSIFTLALSYMAGTISSYYSTQAVFLALGITAIVTIAVTVFCFQTKVDFTKCQGLFCVLGIVIFVTGIITTIVLSIKYIPWLHMLYAAIGAIVFTLFLAYHTQLLIGNRKYSIGPEEYVFAALSIYVDIIQIFLFLLQIIGASNR